MTDFLTSYLESFDPLEDISTEEEELDFQSASTFLHADEAILRQERDQLFTGSAGVLKEQALKDEELDEDYSFFDGVADFASAIPEGVQQEFNDLFSFLDEQTGLTSEKFEIDEPENLPGSFGFGLGQLATGLVPASGVVKAIRAPKLINSFLRFANVGGAKAKRYAAILSVESAGILASQIVFDPNDPNLANIIAEHSEMARPIAEYFASDPTDSTAVNRLRMAAIDTGAAAILLPIFSFVGKGLSKITGTQKVAREVMGLTESERSKRMLAEEYFISKGMTPTDAVERVGKAMTGETVPGQVPSTTSIDDIVEASTGRKASEVYTEARALEGVDERLLGRSALEGHKVEPARAAEVVARQQANGKLDDLVEKFTGQSPAEWKQMAMEEVKEISISGKVPKAPEDPTKSAFLGGTQRFIAQSLRPSMIFEEIQRSFLGFGANPAELKEAWKVFGDDVMGTPAALFDQLENRSFAAVQSYLDPEGTPFLPSIKAGGREASGAKTLGSVFQEHSLAPNEILDFLKWVQAERVEINFKKKGILNVLNMGERGKVTAQIRDAGRVNTKFQNVLEDYSTTMQGILRYAQRAGMISNKEVNSMIKAAKNEDGQYFYAPLFVDPDSASFKGMVAKGKGFKAITGNESADLLDPLQSIVQYMSTTLHKAEINIAKRAFYDMMDRMSLSSDESVSSLASATVERVTVQSLSANKGLQTELKNSLSKLVREASERGENTFLDRPPPPKDGKKSLTDLKPKDIKDMNLFELLQISPSVRQLEAGGKFYDVVFRKGKANLYEVKDPALKDSIEALGTPAVYSLRNSKNFVAQEIVKINDAIRSATKIDLLAVPRKTAQLYSSFVTSFAPFVIANGLRDTFSATANSAFNFVPVASSIKGFTSAITNREIFREMSMAGGMHATRNQAIPRLSDDLARLTKAEGASLVTKNLQRGMIKNYFSKGMDGYKSLVTRVEMAARVAEYRMARKYGMSPELSALMANEVSVNFLKRGSNKLLNSFSNTTSFLNASLQGIHKNARTMRRQPVKYATVVSGVATTSFMFNDYSRQYAEYAGIDEATKMLYTVVPNFANWDTAFMEILEGKDAALDKEQPFFLLPDPHDVGATGGFLEASVRIAFDEESQDDMMSALGRLLHSMTPLIGAPTIIAPLVNTLRNKDQWGNEVVPDFYETDFNRDKMYRPSTNSMAVRISEGSKWLNGLFREGEGEAFIHPLVADHWINYFTPGYLGLVKNAANVAARDPVSGELPGKLPGQSSKSMNPATFTWDMIEARFSLGYGELRAGDQILYNLSKAASDIKRSKGNFEKQTTREIFKKFVTGVDGRQRSIEDMYPTIRSYSQHQQNQNQEITSIRNNRELDSAQKADAIFKVEKNKKEEILRFLSWLEVMDPERDLKRVTKQGSTKPLLFGKK